MFSCLRIASLLPLGTTGVKSTANVVDAAIVSPNEQPLERVRGTQTEQRRHKFRRLIAADARCCHRLTSSFISKLQFLVLTTTKIVERSDLASVSTIPKSLISRLVGKCCPPKSPSWETPKCCSNGTSGSGLVSACAAHAHAVELNICCSDIAAGKCIVEPCNQTNQSLVPSSFHLHKTKAEQRDIPMHAGLYQGQRSKQTWEYSPTARAEPGRVQDISCILQYAACCTFQTPPHSLLSKSS